MWPSAWLEAALPPFLLNEGPLGLQYWQWIASPLLLLLCRSLGGLLTMVTGRIAQRLLRTSPPPLVLELLERTKRPLRVLWTSVLLDGLVSVAGFQSSAELWLDRATQAVTVVSFCWVTAASIDVLRQGLAGTSWAEQHPSFRALIPLGARVGKVVVGLLGALVFLSILGYPVSSVLAGLGIGGLAIALAAQKTVENLFGAFSIGADQPFREGDFVKVEDLTGTVEAIGLRSTRIRTLDRTLVTIPNGKLADLRLESFAARDRLRLACTVGLVYETSLDQVRNILRGLEGVLRQQPKLWPDTVIVRFVGFGASSLNIDVMAWFQTSDWGEFLRIREEVLLEFMAVVERGGSSFAYPTQTLHVQRVGDIV